MKLNKLVPLSNHPFQSFFNGNDSFFEPIEGVMDAFIHDRYPALSDEVGINFEKAAYPKIDIGEDSKEYIISAEIPGLSKENIKVEYDNRHGLLTIRGNKKIKTEKKDDGITWLRREIKESSFCRSVHLNPDLVNENEVKASFKDNYLNITIPKKKETVTDKKKTITIE